ncbi:hypothetical protein [Lacunimicrobium album]
MIDASSHSRPLSLRALVFWPVAFGAVVLMALALLSPKLGQLRRDQEVFVANQHKLVQFEADGQHTRQLIDALENDPRFRAEVAKAVFGQETATKAKSVSLPQELTHDTSARPAATESEANWVMELQPDWLVEAIAPWEQDARNRSISLLGAGGLLLFSFLLLNPNGRRRSNGQTSLWSSIKTRYWHD